MRYLATIGVAVQLTLGSSVVIGANVGVPDYMPKKYAHVISLWLTNHPTYRLATDADCGCEEDLKRERTVSMGPRKARPNYHPYYVVGDFDRDGVADIAVGVINQTSPGMFRVAIFNGPFSKHSTSEAAFLSEPRRLGQGMFFGAPRPKPYMLVVGAFESEGAVLKPTPKGYLLTEEDE